MKTFNHTRPVRDEAGGIVGQRHAPVYRATVESLGPLFDCDRERALVVGLEPGDVVSFRPERTRQKLTVPAKDLYREVLFWQHRSSSLEHARRRKQAKHKDRAAWRLAAAERRLTR